MTPLGVWLLGWVWWLLVPVRRAVARNNLQQALPGAPVSVLRHAVGSVAWGYVELLAGPRVDWQGLEAARGGAVLFTAHLGPWDSCLIEAARICPLTVFLKVPSNGAAALAIERLRRRPGVDLEALPVSNAIEAARDALERGRLIVFVLDQRHAAGLPVDFFGRPAWTSAAFAAMVHRHRPRVFAAHQWRDAKGQVHARAEPVDWTIADDRDQAVPELTSATQRWIEEKVRATPQDWWWLHRRWKAPPSVPK